MRIVMLSTNLAVGGAETQVARLAAEMKVRGHEVHIVSLLPPSAFTQEMQAAGVEVHAPGLLRLPALLRRLRPDVLHCHMYHANVAGRLLRLILPFPAVISTLHSMAESGRGSERIWSRDLLYRLTGPLADCTVAVSHAAAQRHRSAGAVRDARVIPNGVDIQRFHPGPGRRLSSEFTWLAVGRLMWKKNYPALLDAFGQLGRGVLLIAGTGPDEADLRAKAPSNVEFLGARNDVPDLMRAADAFVMSSVVEGLPLVLLEAAASELPCVATDAGGIRETGIGIVTSDLAASMRQVMDMSPEARRELGAGGRRIVLERYSIEVVASQWETLYRTLLLST